MEREILFRAKRLDSGEWAEGCLLADYVTGQYFIHAVGNSVNESGKTNEEGCLKFFAHGADPETVCRYTGKEDANGRPIWEGDYVKIDNDWIGRIIWESRYTAFCVFPNDDMEYETYCLGYYTEECYQVEVIGNMFDNPELKEEETW